MPSSQQIKPYENPYWAISRGPWHSLIFIAPLLAAYEINVWLYGTNILSRSELQSFLHNISPAVTHFSAVLIIAVMLIWQWLSGDSWKIRLEAVAMMAMEAALLAVPLLGLGMMAEHIAAASINHTGQTNALSAALFTRMGAGIYEEFIFRLAAFNLLGLLLNDMLKLKREKSLWIILAVTSLAFAWRHFPGNAVIIWPKFLFYAACGLYLGSIFLLRGFGLSVGAHVFYNIYVTLIEYA